MRARFSIGRADDADARDLQSLSSLFFDQLRERFLRSSFDGGGVLRTSRCDSSRIDPSLRDKAERCRNFGSYQLDLSFQQDDRCFD